MSLKIILRKYFSIILNILGLAPKFWQDSSKYFVTIDYHYFSDNNEISHPSLEINRNILELQLKFFHKNMHIIDPKHLGTNLFSMLKSDMSSILFSIDDADISFQENFDLFQKYKIPVILFVPFGLCLKQNTRDGLMSRILRSFFEIEKNKLLSLKQKEDFFNSLEAASMENLNKIYKDLLLRRDKIDPISSRVLLSIEELQKLSKDSLITIGSHSMSHPILSEVPEKWLNWELSTSKKYLHIVNGDEKYFAYPYGFKASTNSEIKQKLKKLGIKYAFLTRSTVITADSDKLELGRVGMLNFFNARYLRGLTAFEVYDKLLHR